MIWCDLDETLIWTWRPLITTPFMAQCYGLPMDTKPPCGRGRRKLRQVNVPDLGIAHTCERKSARQFLSALRQFGEVRMLTAADRRYALAMNEAFAFGFLPEQIVSRETLGYSPSNDSDPEGILIENVDHGGVEWRRRQEKFWYLGKYAALVKVPAFYGRAADKFDRTWPEFVDRVKAALQRKPGTLSPYEQPYVRPEMTTSDIDPIAIFERARRKHLRKVSKRQANKGTRKALKLQFPSC